MSAIPWSAEEKATLYGWLDYGVKVLGYSKEDFFSTVGIKLEDSGSTRHDVNKITSKLKRDWFRYGSTGYDFDDIFKDLVGIMHKGGHGFVLGALELGRQSCDTLVPVQDREPFVLNRVVSIRQG